MLGLDTVQIASIAGALAVYALAVPMPGPSFVVITRSAVREGREAGIFAALGTTLAAAAYASCAILGVGVVLSVAPWLVDAIQILGGAYLLYLGTRLLVAHCRGACSASMASPATGPIKSSSRLLITWKAFLVAASNPKMAVFFLGLFAPAAGLQTDPSARCIILVGIVVIDLCYHQTLARFVATASRSKMARNVHRWLDVAAGGAMATFGGGLMIQAIVRTR